MASANITLGQGTITFNGAAHFAGTNYYESGMWFRVATPSPGPHDDMGVGGPITGPSNIPYNDSPYMIFVRFYSPDDYVTISLTNGSSFGLSSVQLADPNSPSYSLLPIAFLGHKADGSTVTDTFTTPGNGADHLANYQFTTDFAWGLTSVEIDSTRWAMDNLVYTVPEPSTAALVGLGLLALILRRRGTHA